MVTDFRFACSARRSKSVDGKYVTQGDVDTPYGVLFMICNGLGGPHGGIIASSITFEIIKRIMKSMPSRSLVKLLTSAIKEANRAVYTRAHDNIYMYHTGTSLVLLLIDLDGLNNGLMCNIGRSRIYRIRDGSITQMANNHSMVSDIIDNDILEKKDVLHHSKNNILTRSIGTREDVEPEIHKISIEEGDKYILCTHDITDSIYDSEIMRLFETDTQKYADNILEKVRNRSDQSDSVVQIIDFSAIPGPRVPKDKNYGDISVAKQ